MDKIDVLVRAMDRERLRNTPTMKEYVLMALYAFGGVFLAWVGVWVFWFVFVLLGII